MPSGAFEIYPVLVLQTPQVPQPETEVERMGSLGEVLVEVGPRDSTSDSEQAKVAIGRAGPIKTAL